MLPPERPDRIHVTFDGDNCETKVQTSSLTNSVPY